MEASWRQSTDWAAVWRRDSLLPEQMNLQNTPATRNLPHYFLRCEIEPAELPGHWRFELTRPDGAPGEEAADVEPGVGGIRLELLTVVRALESLDEPSRITLLNPSATLRQGILYGLADWRAYGWQWEWFGQLVPIKNADLWQRLDQAMQFHHVECRRWRLDSAHGAPGGPLFSRQHGERAGTAHSPPAPPSNSADAPTQLRAALRRPLDSLACRVQRMLQHISSRWVADEPRILPFGPFEPPPKRPTGAVPRLSWRLKWLAP